MWASPAAVAARRGGSVRGERAVGGARAAARLPGPGARGRLAGMQGTRGSQCPGNPGRDRAGGDNLAGCGLAANWPLPPRLGLPAPEKEILGIGNLSAFPPSPF